MKKADLKKRELLQAGAATALFAAMPATAFAGTRYIKSDREVCHGLDKLVDYRTGEPYVQKGFAVVYASTPHNTIEEEGGCENDLMKLAEIVSAARRYVDEPVEAVIIFSKSEEGDPKPAIADGYTNPNNAGFKFVGLTAEKQLVKDVALEYGVSFTTSRKTKKVTGHTRFTALISPQGELIARYLPDKPKDLTAGASLDQFEANNLSKITENIIRHIRGYDADDIHANPKCDL